MAVSGAVVAAFAVVGLIAINAPVVYFTLRGLRSDRHSPPPMRGSA